MGIVLLASVAVLAVCLPANFWYVARVRARLDAKIETLRRETALEVARLDARIDELQKESDGEALRLEAKLEDIRADVHAMEGDVTEMRDRVSEVVTWRCGQGSRPMFKARCAHRAGE